MIIPGVEGLDTTKTQEIELQTPDFPSTIVSHLPTSSRISISPISTSLRANELGKLMLTVGLPAAVAILVMRHNLQGAAVALMVGCTLIWIGILIRTPLDRLADILELIGTGVVLASLFGLVAASQSKLFCTTILWVCCALCWLPLLLSLFYHVKMLITSTDQTLINHSTDQALINGSTDQAPINNSEGVGIIIACVGGTVIMIWHSSAVPFLLCSSDSEFSGPPKVASIDIEGVGVECLS